MSTWSIGPRNTNYFVHYTLKPDSSNNLKRSPAINGGTVRQCRSIVAQMPVPKEKSLSTKIISKEVSVVCAYTGNAIQYKLCQFVVNDNDGKGQYKYFSVTNLTKRYQYRFYFFFQAGDIIFNYIPCHFCVNTKILMNKNISHPDDLRPFNIGKPFF